jgi:signal transduction histidine kinase
VAVNAATLSQLPKESQMNKQLIGVSASLLLATGYALADEYGSADEAKAMLKSTVAAIKADKTTALRQLSSGEAGFRDRDLYPFCIGPDGNFSAHPALVGQNLRDLKDKSGKSLGETIYEAAQEGRITEVDYLWPHPGTATPVEKALYVTRVDDQVCAVRFYE